MLCELLNDNNNIKNTNTYYTKKPLSDFTAVVVNFATIFYFHLGESTYHYCRQ